MEKSLVVLILFCLIFTANAQTPDSCEQIRLRWADTTDTDIKIITGGVDPGFYTQLPFTAISPGMPGGYIVDTGIKYPYRYFPETKQPKIKLWGNTQPFKIGTYRVTNTKLAGWAVLSFAGAIDGVVEGYEFDGRTSFERKYGVSPNGYFGSRSWEGAHTKEALYTRAFGAWDFYHHADDVRKIGYISGGVIIGIGSTVNTKWWHYAVDLAASFAVSGVAKSAGMFWIRN